MLLDPDTLHSVQRQGGANYFLHAHPNIAWTSACVSTPNRKPGLIKAPEQPSATSQRRVETQWKTSPSPECALRRVTPVLESHPVNVKHHRTVIFCCNNLHSILIGAP